MIRRVLPWVRRGRAAPAPAEPPGALRVLMVCMGNICRSPTAEVVLRSKLVAAGLDRRVVVDSAGTYGGHAGEPPDPRSVRHAAARGYDLSGLRARAVQADDFERFHRLLAMDEDNLDWLRGRAPEPAQARLALLMKPARRHAGVLAVPDPYYGPPAAFEHVLDLVEDACDGWVQALAAELGGVDGVDGVDA